MKLDPALAACLSWASIFWSDRDPLFVYISNARAKGNTVQIRLGKTEQIDEIMMLIRGIVSHMNLQGIFQWDEIYPNREVIANDVGSGTLYTATVGEETCGIIVLNEHQDPEYQQIGWEFPSNKTLVVHRLAVHPDWQGKGLGSALMGFAEGFAHANGYDVIRLDAFAQNKAAVALYRGRGYRLAGTVNFRKGPFFCFERQVNQAG